MPLSHLILFHYSLSLDSMDVCILRHHLVVFCQLLSCLPSVLSQIGFTFARNFSEDNAMLSFVHLSIQVYVCVCVCINVVCLCRTILLFIFVQFLFYNTEPKVRQNFDSTVTVCHDYMRGNCAREWCRYYHPPQHITTQLNPQPALRSFVTPQVCVSLCVCVFVNYHTVVTQAYQLSVAVCSSSVNVYCIKGQ